MIGITLTADQVRTAPAAVRLWIEREVAKSLGLQLSAPGETSDMERIAVCSLQELTDVLSLIQSVFPAVNVLFELGREGVAVGDGRLSVSRVSDMMHHVRLHDVDQVIYYLQTINEALHRVRGAADAGELCVFDSEGHCCVATQTQQNILRLWQEMIRGRQADPHDLMGGGAGTARPEFAFGHRPGASNATDQAASNATS